MPRALVNIRPIIVVRVAGDVEGSRISDLVIDGLSIEVPTSLKDGAPFVMDLLTNVNTWDGEIIQLLENIRKAVEPEALYMLPLSDEVANG